MKVLLNSFHLNGHTLGFRPPTGVKARIETTLTGRKFDYRKASHGLSWGGTPLYNFGIVCMALNMV